MNFGYKKTVEKRKQLSSKSKKAQSRAGVYFFKIMLYVVILAIVVTGFAGLGMAKGILDSAPSIDTLNISPTGLASRIYDNNGNEIERISASGSNRELASIDQMPSSLTWAFVDIEDERFYEHNGIDLKGILRAAFVAVTSRDFSEGASTITQQLIKNNVFENGGQESNIGALFVRKLQEQYLSIELEKVMGKNEILENYLNTINLGSGNYGVKAAVKFYFNKDLSELTVSECAVIAAIAQNPTRLNPLTNPENNAERRKKILSNMLSNGHITEAEYEEAMNDDVYSRIQSVSDSNDSSIYSYFTDALIDQVLTDLEEQKGYTSAQAINALYNGGLSIYTTQDSTIQQICDEELANDANYATKIEYSTSWTWSIQKSDGTNKNYSQENILSYHKKDLGETSYKLIYATKEAAQADIDAFKASVLEEGDTVLGENTIFTPQPQASFSVVDQTTGYVKALVGGRGTKETSLSLNRATDTTRQPGSCFKIVAAYAPALDTAGYTLGTVIDDAPFNYANGQPVNNWYSGYRGLSTVREGIRDSMNILAVKTITAITPSLAYDYLLNFGFSTLTEDDINQATALGGITYGVTNLELCSAYATIANGGVYTEPTLYTKILDSEGQVLIEHTAKTHTVLKESTAYLLTNAMQDVITSGTGKTAAVPGMTVAGKTGTSQDTNDLWFAGYTPYLTAAIWIGYDENKQMSDVSYHNRIWSKIMTRIDSAFGYTDTPFKTPDSIEAAQICSISGKLAIPGVCDHDPAGSTVITEYFAKGTVPTETCNAHTSVTICNVSGQLANEYCPADSLTQKVFRIRPEGSVGVTPDTAFEMPAGLLDNVCTIHTAVPSTTAPASTEKATEGSTASTASSASQ
ncbi:transglycosylase domain-containing protein [Parasporobacterium paucivorans]|uniref:Penicillin-binding protein 1A n=1 Tax=Parasporobacterium paucivorans DSM 15970 TaxID=1122934 RepID=A0A1M6CC77_9FIRM|nr:PBP1A family penicillin-binding protein [Parasporobacterium paucivorans]SHI58612.1 penicillin-binding protein 1A [Parasporobacterium paucivorans DSM 15970]